MSEDLKCFRIVERHRNLQALISNRPVHFPVKYVLVTSGLFLVNCEIQGRHIDVLISDALVKFVNEDESRLAEISKRKAFA